MLCNSSLLTLQYAHLTTRHLFTHSLFLTLRQIECMEVLVICPPERTSELGLLPDGFFIASDVGAAANRHCDAVVDLLYEDDPEAHATVLRQIHDKPVLVSAVTLTCSQLPAGVIRINGWPHFFDGNLIEACTSDDSGRAGTIGVLGLLGKKPEWVPDVPGMISARIVASIINEAYFALSEGIATPEAIDTAMKLGTAYPFGPFAWAEKIGLKKVAALLNALAQTEPRYKPCALLAQKAPG